MEEEEEEEDDDDDDDDDDYNDFLEFCFIHIPRKLLAVNTRIGVHKL